MDVVDDDMGLGEPAWSQKCVCGKRFAKPNSYTNHIRGCLPYKNKMQNSLNTAQARWREKPKLRPPVADDDLDLDVDGPVLPPRHVEPPPQEQQIIEPASWKTTPANHFGLYRRYWTVEENPYDPEFFRSEDLDNSSSTDSSDDPDPSPKLNPFRPFPNWSSLCLGEWRWSEGDGKSRESFQQLIDIITNESFRPEDVCKTNWDKIHQTLGSSQFDEPNNYPWVDDGLSWQTVPIVIDVPLNSTSIQPGPVSFTVGELRYRPLVPLITSFYIVPSELRWQPRGESGDVRVYGDMHHSPAGLEAYRDIQQSATKPEGCTLPRYVVALMFASDETTLTSFGDASVWPTYLCFGNESKDLRAKTSLKLFEEIAYLQQVPAGQFPGLHLHREVFHQQWRAILDDDFVEAYQYGIKVECFDSVERRFFPRIMTYIADYPENISQLGSPSDRTIRLQGQRRDDSKTREKVKLARKYIYQKDYAINARVVETVLKPTSLVPSQNAFSDRLSSLGLDIYSLPAVDPLHEVEIGVWKSLFIQLLRLLDATPGAPVNHLNSRFRQVPTFGRDTIRRFCTNVSEMKQFAAREYEDILQCAIPVFEGLFPEEHNDRVLNLLFTFAHWHSLLKLRLHTDHTLDILDDLTTTLGEDAREFMSETCGAFETRELEKEYNARLRRQARDAARRAKEEERAQREGDAECDGGKSNVGKGKGGRRKGKKNKNTEGKGEEEQRGKQQSPARGGQEVKEPRKLRTWSLNTPKFHSLGDAVSYIRQYGTTDSYSTQLVRYSKARYKRTNKKNVDCQLSLLQTRSARLQRLRKQQASPSEEDGVQESRRTWNLDKSYVVAKSQDRPLGLFDFLRLNSGDPAVKDFLPKLKDHLFPRIIGALLDEAQRQPQEHASSLPILKGLAKDYSEDDLRNIFFHADHIYQHKVLQINYTAYDCRRSRDILNPSTSRRDVMCLRRPSGDAAKGQPTVDRYIYGRILGIFHVNVIYAGPGRLDYSKRRFDFVWVRWFKSQSAMQPWSSKRLDRVALKPLTDGAACGFVDPADIIRAAHIIPRFSLGTVVDELEGILYFIPWAREQHTEHRHIARRFVDRDMAMRFHWGLGIGHRQPCADRPPGPVSSGQEVPMDVDKPTIPSDEELMEESDDGESTDSEDPRYDAGDGEGDDDRLSGMETGEDWSGVLGGEGIQEPETSDEE
ncbi:hypothetical protein FA13DRAFT_1756603 [Coprinellus micaceus]|uniref:Uncharacterized protein n=1 Tax=Coprinellus micaceus TaxID=71717 RepID=A0A4Y7SUH3_COPMI|nr:hypothetical protein FA13DRAFT_1756603 [Coprinellus micaceus]